MNTQRVSRIHWGLNVGRNISGISVKDVCPVKIELDCSNCNGYSDLINDCVKPGDKWNFHIIASCRRCSFTYFLKASFDEREYDLDVRDDKNHAIDEFTVSGKISEIYPPVKEVIVPEEIPDRFRKDFLDAKLILKISPKASAALCRRVLQDLVRQVLKDNNISINSDNLFKEIEEFIKLPNIPSYISEQIDVTRLLGNLAAHPIGNKDTGVIFDVEPKEAEWLILILDLLLDYLFVFPIKTQQRIEQFKVKHREVIGKDANFQVPPEN